MPALKYSDILAAYNSLREKFLGVADAARLKVSDAGFKIRGGKTTKVEALLYLQEWPWRPSSTKKSLDILVKVEEEFSDTSERIKNANVRVAYYTVKTDEATPVLQIHYDFDDPVKSAHPVFHAQFGEITWKQAELNELGFNRKVKAVKLPAFHKHRIPTAFMGYGPILLALAADHLDSASYATFLAVVRKNKSIEWSAVCDPLEKSIKKHGGYLHSHHWY
jgi:hypothetical protein